MADDQSLRHLADKAGIASRWTDNSGVEHLVSPETLRATMTAMGLACANQSDINTSSVLLDQRNARESLPPLVTAAVNQPINLPLRFAKPIKVRIDFENGEISDLELSPGADGASALPAISQTGYHRLTCGGKTITLAVAPSSAWTFADASAGQKSWGLTAQTHALRPAAPNTGLFEPRTSFSFGIGGFRELASLGEAAAARGADGIMISPSHALFHADSAHFSPYSPSSRFFYNALLADPCATFPQLQLNSLFSQIKSEGVFQLDENAGMIDWQASSQAKQAFLREIYERFRSEEYSQPGNPLAADFEQFRSDGGTLLHQHAVFETLHARQYQTDFNKWHWQSWPAAFKDPVSVEVKQFAREHSTDVDYHMFLQWLSRRSLESTQHRMRDAGMRIGIISDMAVGVNAGGSHAWSRPDDVLSGLSIGAPPDALAPLGQNWGLTTFAPHALIDSGFETFIATLRACMAPVGGVRIDHVMGLSRLWLIPDGGGAKDGAYVSFPSEDLLRLIALESQRDKKIVVGEDLGTVPHGLRETLSGAGLAGMRVLLFERDWEGYRKPEHYSPDAIAMPTTHDTPTLRGWRRSLDIEHRARLDLLPPDHPEEIAKQQRSDDVAALDHALEIQARNTGYADQLGIRYEEGSGRDETEFVAAAIAYTAQSQAPFVAIPLEEITAQLEQPNLPGTSIEHPNWQLRYEENVSDILGMDTARRHLDILRAIRPKD